MGRSRERVVLIDAASRKRKKGGMVVRTWNRFGRGGLFLVVLGVLVSALLMVGQGQAQAQTVPLTDQETSDLLFLREEEKLARDVYLVLYDTWHTRIFTNIAKSEQNHMDAVLLLLEKYKLTDPASPSPGVFNNSELQGLYNYLIGFGSGSLTDALKVGVIIENRDIQDLNTFLAETQKFDLQTVYNNLKDGSENHLAAFTSELKKRVK
jgi:hypothetical protein